MSPGKLSGPWRPCLHSLCPFLSPRRFLIKGSVAGGAVYLVYDQELLGPSDKSEAALRKAEEVVPPAMYQFSQYVCQQTGLEMPQVPWLGMRTGLQVGSECPWHPLHPCLVEFCVSGFGWQGCDLSPCTSPCAPLSSQLPAPPKINFTNLRDSWNSGRPLCPSLGDPGQPSLSKALFNLTVPFHSSLCARMSPTELSRRDWVCQPMLVTSVLGGLRQEDSDIKAS